MRLRSAVSAFLAFFATPLLAHLAAPSLAHAESFTYDSQNRLVRIDNGSTTTTLQYDAFG